MGARGPAPTPALQIVREGNPGHHGQDRTEGGVKLPPARPPEPDWAEWFAPRLDLRRRRKRRNETPADVAEREAANRAVDEQRAGVQWAIDQASATWAWVCGVLDPAGLVTLADQLILTDLCVTWVRIREAERDVSEHGLSRETDRGIVRNGSIITAGQYRAHWKWLCGQLGLSPVARDSLKGGADDDEDSPFDV